MAGPSKQFDREVVLKKALEVFWAKGFGATSMQDLVDHMEINRASMYDTFGGKQDLFVLAFDWYCSNSLKETTTILQGSGSPIGNIRKYFQNIGETAGTATHHGCFINNTAVEMGPHDDEIAEKIRIFWQQMEKLFRETLERAKVVGELKPDADTLTLARFINTTLQGIVVKSKVGVPYKQIADMVKTMLKLITTA